MDLNRILLIVAVLMAVSALAVSLDGRFRPLPGTAHAKHSSSSGDSACGCGNLAKKQEGGCGAGCCGGGGKSSGGCATGLHATAKAKAVKK